MTKFFTTNNIRSIRINAERAKLDRSPSMSLQNSLDPEGVHLIQNHISLDGGRFVRCIVIFKIKDRDDGKAAQIDMTLQDYNALANVEDILEVS